MYGRPRIATGLLALACLLALPSERGASAHDGPRRFRGPFHLERKPRRRVLLVLEGTIRTPGFRPDAWVVVLPQAPDHLWQTVVSQTFRITGDDKKHPRAKLDILDDEVVPGRKLRRIHFKPEKPVSEVRYVYEIEAVLNEVRLAPGRARERQPRLSRKARKIFLAARGAFDHDKPAFRTWLAKNALLKGENERDLDFAHRTLAHIHQKFGYRFPPEFTDRFATQVCREKASDCGGLCILFASVMRANGIPARVLAGRWALETKEGKPQYHVRAEFWAGGVGWVPIDGSGAVQWAGAPDSAFGRQKPNFFIMHEDVDLDIDTVYFGVVPIRFLQSPAYWVRGPGTFRGAELEATWRVQEKKRER
jgi:hypothetical protein